MLLFIPTEETIDLVILNEAENLVQQVNLEVACNDQKLLKLHFEAHKPSVHLFTQDCVKQTAAFCPPSNVRPTAEGRLHFCGPKIIPEVY